jgi:hypothetical protein
VCHRQPFFPAAADVVLGAALALAADGFAVDAFGVEAFGVEAFAAPEPAAALFPVEIPVIFTWVYRWRWPSRRR